ncbi:MAG TPA: hypothetical protein VHZ26_14340 [Caulobacteraceae bacterium]|nr:hypothetical protein [Caulobacteraceae bacterium]
MVTYVTYVLQLCAIPLAGGVAVFKGDKPERYGAIILLTPTLIEDVVLPVARHFGYPLHDSMPYVELLSTFAVSSGFLYLAVRYASLWLAAAMVVQGTELYFARAFIDSSPRNFNLYATEVNIITASVLGILGGAAVVSWRARSRKQHSEAKRAELVVERERARDRKFREMFEGRPAPVSAPARTHRGVARLTIEPPPL